MTIWPRSSEKARTALRCLRARVKWRTADRWPVMAGSAHGRFPLIRNNSSCKTPEADYPWAFLPALEALTSCLAFEEDYPRAFLLASVVLASSHTSEEEHPRAFLQASVVLASSYSFEEDYPRAFLPALEALTSCLAFEEDYPMAFLPTSEVSHPPILPKKTTRGSDYSSSGGSRVLMMAFSNSAIPTAPRCIKGLPSIGMKRREGIERIPNRAASSFSSSTLTL